MRHRIKIKDRLYWLFKNHNGFIIPALGEWEAGWVTKKNNYSFLYRIRISKSAITDWAYTLDLHITVNEDGHRETLRFSDECIGYSHALFIANTHADIAVCDYFPKKNSNKRKTGVL